GRRRRPAGMGLPAQGRWGEGRPAAPASGGSPLVCLPVPALAQATDGMAVDLHSHAGNLIPMSYGRGSFSAVAEPMRQGGMSTICLAVVADSPIIRLTDGGLRPSRNPNPAELS